MTEKVVKLMRKSSAVILAYLILCTKMRVSYLNAKTERFEELNIESSSIVVSSKMAVILSENYRSVLNSTTS